jgi:hypothetical protein
MKKRAIKRNRLLEATILLDLVASMSYREFMPSVIEVVEKLKERLTRDVKTVEDARRELDGLKDVAARILDLECQMDDARIRIIRVVRMLGDKQTRTLLAKNPAFAEDRQELRKASKYSRSETVSLRSFMEEYLRIVRKAKVGDIVEFLQAVGVDYAKRQTIEAVVRRHPDEFKITKRNREKFVSLTSQSDW